MDKQYLYFLDVGQGMCTYFEEFEGGDIVANALFDLGSTNNGSRAGPPTIEFLVNQIKARDWLGDDGELDVVFLSHKDADHINLLWKLLAALPNMHIGCVYHSGPYDWYTSDKPFKGADILAALGARTFNAKKNVRNFTIGYSGMAFTPWVPVWDTEYGAKAYVIAVNTSLASTHTGQPATSYVTKKKNKPDSELANATSLGIYLQMYKVGVVLYGDATFTTFQFTNQLFAAQTITLTATFSIEAPHHGSRKTTFGLSKTNAAISTQAQAVVDTFARNAGGATVIVSADTSHCHPSLETINTFVNFADKTTTWWADPAITPYHLASVYFDIARSTTEAAPNKYYTYQTAQNFYTTLYQGLESFKWDYSFPPKGPAVTPPAMTAFSEGMNWFYEILPTSTVAPANIAMLGVANARLPKSAASLYGQFEEARARMARAPLAIPQAIAEPASGAPRAPARAPATLRRLKPRP